MTDENWSQAIEDIYEKVKSGKATKGEVFRLLTSLQTQDERNETTHKEKVRPPTPPQQKDTYSDQKRKALSVSEFIQKSAALDEIELVSESKQRPSRRRDKDTQLRRRSNEHTQRHRNNRSLRDTRRRNKDFEYSFQPDIKELPKSYGVDKAAYENVEFNKRVNLWKSKKAKQIQKKKEERVMNELEKCTFRPAINEKSKTVAEFRRQHNYMAVSDRLYRTKIHKGVDQRRKELEKKRDEDFMKQCTFKPRVMVSSSLSSSKRLTGTVKSIKTTRAMKQAKLDAMKECTFRPKVNGVRKGMEAANRYLEMSCFDRLSRPIISKKDDDDDDDDDEKSSLLDMDTFMTRTRRGEDESSSFSSNNSSSSKKPRKSIKKFLQRQEQHLIMKEKHIEDKKQMEAKAHQPAICKKSKKICEERGTFMQRLEQQSLRTRVRLRREKDRKDPNCTFRPKITNIAKKTRARTVRELSDGDANRRETTRRVLKLKADQELMNELTFKPKLSIETKLAPRAQGRLQILKAPHTYVRRMKRAAKMKQEQQRRKAQDAELDEFSECTFHPKIHDAPAYVKKIARSMSLSRSVKREVSDDSARPEWR